MGRVSQAQARENRQRVVETASRLFREQGVDVSVADLMQAAGLTHGGFYKQFASKEALVDEATAHAFAERARQYEEDAARYAGASGPDAPGADARAVARRDLIDAYLSPEHRDNPAEGCPIAGLATDMARTPADRDAHHTYARGAEAYAGRLADEDGDDDGLTRLSTMVGALVLARATRGTPLSDEILKTVRTSLTRPEV
ncbi:TetR family transcriptional regulator [Streptomyces sp. SID8379]|uniref:TetR/AcrR family transcriptional regulator n=1 Tax=unclassified Streptomyces TaxID=2593676 RepID=UPI000370D1BF|nr:MULTISPECIES: TetR family transcriptional regulator [unclassified Streptomyces]MYW62553.1 TetR family transcriptional regulator [Streptomyces sp. SID8379]